MLFFSGLGSEMWPFCQMYKDPFKPIKQIPNYQNSLSIFRQHLRYRFSFHNAVFCNPLCSIMESSVQYYGIHCAVLWNPLCSIMESALQFRESAVQCYGIGYAVLWNSIQFSGYVNNYVRNCSSQLLSPLGMNEKQPAISTAKMHVLGWTGRSGQES